MSKLFILLLLAINLQTAQAQEPGGTVTTGRSAVELSIIKTSDVTTLEAFTYSGGDYTKAVKLQHVAVLVRHPKGSLLFDTGLGKD